MINEDLDYSLLSFVIVLVNRMIKMKGYFKVLLLITCCFYTHSNNISAQELELRKNFGWASETKGGLGGKVVKVTNLNSEGEGSLAYALSLDEKRIIVFEVGGVIDMKGKTLNVEFDNMTLLGQSAPSPGITITNGGIRLHAKDIIIQHIKVRPGSTYANESLDGLSTYGKVSNIIIDHCSFTWATDENLSASGPRFRGHSPSEWRDNTSHSITFSNNIIGEGLYHSAHKKGGHSMGTLIHDNVTNVLLMRNLYVSNNARNALFKCGSNGVFLNNYIFNPGIRAIQYVLVDKEWVGYEPQIGYLSVIGNYLQKGVDTRKKLAMFSSLNGPLQLFMKDNKMFDIIGNEITDLYEGNEKNIVKIRPIWHDGLMVLESMDLPAYMKGNVGARPWDRDEIDKRILKEVFERTSRIIDSESVVGGINYNRSTHEKFDDKKWDLKNNKRK